MLYRVWRVEDELADRWAYAQCLNLLMLWMHHSPAMLVKAAELKATYRRSLADAWIAACATIERATLVHKDPGFRVVPVGQECWPLKGTKRRS